MAIDILRNNAIKAMPENVASSRCSKLTTKEAKQSSSVSASSLSTDDVVFTDNAKKLSKAAELAIHSEGIDYDKVARIKKQLAEGTYNINYERVADKMIAHEGELNSIFA